MEQIIFAFQSEKKAIQEAAEEDKATREKTFFEETNRLKREHEHSLEEHRIANENAYDRNLDARTKQILAENRRMAVELSMHKHVRQRLLFAG